MASKALLSTQQGTQGTQHPLLLPFTEPVMTSLKAIRLIGHDFSLVNTCCLHLISFFSSNYLEMASRTSNIFI